MFIVWVPESDDTPKAFRALADARKFAHSELQTGMKGERAEIFDAPLSNTRDICRSVAEGKIKPIEYIGRRATSQEERARAREFLRQLGIF